MEGKRYVHLPRFCCIFAPDGTFKMPTATLLPENRGRWRPFYPSTGRGDMIKILHPPQKEPSGSSNTPATKKDGPVSETILLFITARITIAASRQLSHHVNHCILPIAASCPLLHHAAHSACRHCRSRFLFRNFGDGAFCGEEHSSH